MQKHPSVEIDFDKVVSIANTEGWQAASEFVAKEYGLGYQNFKRLLRLKGTYTYNKKIKKYEVVTTKKDPFMSIEEMSQTKSVPHAGTQVGKVKLVPQSFDDLMSKLIKDRLLEISKFLELEQSTKRLKINMSYLKKDGYTVEFL